MDYAIGIDVGATNIKTVAVTTEGRLLARSQEPTSETDPAWAERVRAQIARLSNQFGKTERIGIAAPGLAAPDERRIAWMQGRMASVQGLDWTTYLGAKRLIPVLNDAHAALLGEIWQGAAQGGRNVLMLTLGTGVGGAAVVDGRLLRGHLGRAGHLGHICLNADGPKDIVNTPGSLEDAIGDCTIRQRSGGRFPSTLELIRAREAGDAEAGEIWERAVHALACGLISLINAFDPERVLLGGGIVQAGAALWTPLEQFLDEYEWRPTGRKVPIVPAALGEWAGAYGAATNALRATGNDHPD